LHGKTLLQHLLPLAPLQLMLLLLQWGCQRWLLRRKLTDRSLGQGLQWLKLLCTLCSRQLCRILRMLSTMWHRQLTQPLDRLLMLCMLCSLTCGHLHHALSLQLLLMLLLLSQLLLCSCHLRQIVHQSLLLLWWLLLSTLWKLRAQDLRAQGMPLQGHRRQVARCRMASHKPLLSDSCPLCGVCWWQGLQSACWGGSTYVQSWTCNDWIHTASWWRCPQLHWHLLLLLGSQKLWWKLLLLGLLRKQGRGKPHMAP